MKAADNHYKSLFMKLISSFNSSKHYCSKQAGNAFNRAKTNINIAWTYIYQLSNSVEQKASTYSKHLVKLFLDNAHHLIKTIVFGVLCTITVTRFVSPLLRLIGVNMGLNSIQILEFYCIGIAAQAKVEKHHEQKTSAYDMLLNHLSYEKKKIFRWSMASYIFLSGITTLSYFLYLTDTSRILNTPLYKLVEISSNVMSLPSAVSSGFSWTGFTTGSLVSLYPLVLTYLAGLSIAYLASHKSGRSLFHYVSLNNIIQSAVFATLTNAAYLFVGSEHYEIAAAVYTVSLLPLLEFAYAALNNDKFDYHKGVALYSIGIHLTEAVLHILSGGLRFTSHPWAISTCSNMFKYAQYLSSDRVQAPLIALTSYSCMSRVKADIGDLNPFQAK